MNIPPLPENFVVGSAVEGADCFFHSMMKCLQQLNVKYKPLSVNVLRLKCKEYAIIHLNQRDSWMKDLLLELENVSLQGYERRIGLSAKDMGSDKATSLNMTEAICGRPEIEGRLICDNYDVKLHVIEELLAEDNVLSVDPNLDNDGFKSARSEDYNEKELTETLLQQSSEINGAVEKVSDDEDDKAVRDKMMKTWRSMMVDKLIYGYVDHVDYEAMDTIHILKHSKNLYKPILRENDGSSDEEKITNQLSYKLSAVVRSKMSEERMLKKIKVLLENGANIDFRDRNDRCNTALHVAVRKRKLRVVKFLVENNANVHLPNMENVCAMEYAERIKRRDILDMLRNERKMPKSNAFATIERSQELTEKTQLTFKRPSDDSGASGQRYEVNLLTLFKLRGEKMTNDFYLAGNLSAAGDFDDVVFKYWNESVSKVIFLQAKHRQDTGLRKIDFETFTADKDFDLRKYFKSYLGIKGMFQKETGNPIFKGEFENSNCEFVMLTNASLVSNPNSVILQDTGKDSFEIGKGGKAIKLDPDYALEYLTSKEYTEYVSLLSKKFIDFVLSSKKDSVMASEDVVKEYHVFWAQWVLEINHEIHVKPNKKLKSGDQGKRFRYANLRQEFLQGPIENSLMRQFRNEVVMELQKSNLCDKVMTIPEEFGNIGPTFIHSIESLCVKFVELISQTESVDGTCVISKVNDRKLLKDLSKLVGNVLVLNENTGFLKLNNKELEAEAKEVRDNLVDTMKRKCLDPKMDFDFQISGFPKLLLSYRSKTEKDKRDFIKKLTVYTNQPSVKELDDVIKNEIKSFYQLTDVEVNSNALRINDKMTRYWMETGSVAFLRKGDGFFGDVLHKVVHVHAMMPLDSFTGRVTELRLLHELLQNQMVVICGLGGIGKSELARKYVSDYREFYDGNIVWIHADNSAALQHSFRQLCQGSLNIPVINDDGSQRKMKHIIRDIHRFFAQRKCLFIFDNAENLSEGESEIERFLKQPCSENALKLSVIITSRNSDWQTGKILPLGAFSDDEAELFVKSSLKTRQSQNGDVKSLMNLLQNSPLALQQAVAFIREKDADSRISNLNNEFRISDYLRLFEENTRKVIDFKFPEDSLDHYTYTTYNTWNITFKTFTQLHCGREATCILYVMAYLIPYNIPVQLFYGFAERTEETIIQALQLLKRYALITVDESMANVHRLVQNVCRTRLRADEQEVFALRTALSLLSKCHTNKDILTLGMTVWNYAICYHDLVCDFWFTPVQILNGLIKDARYQEAYSFGLAALESLKSNLGTDHFAIVIIEEQLANSQSYLGRYEEALTSLSNVLEKRDSVLGRDHLPTLGTKKLMAVTLNKQGKYDEALVILEELLKESKNVFGPHNKFTLSVQHNTAETLYNQGKYEEALEMFTEVFEKSSNILGPDNEGTLTAQHNIVNVLAAQFKPKALDVCKDLFKKVTKTFGSHHPKTLCAQILVASALVHQDKYEEALISYRDVHQKRTKIFGIDHPDTVAVQNDIAIVLCKQGNRYDALSCYRDMLEREIKTLGPDHPSTLTTQCNIAAMLLQQGKSENVQSFKDALSKLAQKLGSCHPETLHFQTQVVQALRSHGQHEEAYKYNEGLSEKCRSILGPNHPKTLIAETELAVAVRSRGEYEEALNSFKKILVKMARIFGPENKLTLEVQHYIAETLSYQGKYDDALSIYEAMILKQTQILGSDHPDILITLQQKSSVLFKQGKYDEALCDYKELFDKSTRILGPDHPDTIETIETQRNITQIMFNAGRYEEALCSYKEVLDKLTKIFGTEHSKTLRVQAEMASALSRQGKYDEALCSYQVVFEKRMKILGPHHPDALAMRNNMDRILNDETRHKQVLASLDAGLKKRMDSLGGDHPETLIVQENLALALSRQGRHEEALPYYRDLLEKQLKSPVPDLIAILNTRQGIALQLSRLGKPEAIQSLKDVYEQAMQMFGPDHECTLINKMQVAQTLTEFGQHDEASRYNKDLIEKFTKVMEPDHILTLRAECYVAFSLHLSGKHEEAVRSFVVLFEKCTNVLGSDHSFTSTVWQTMAQAMSDPK